MREILAGFMSTDMIVISTSKKNIQWLKVDFNCKETNTAPSYPS